MEHTVDVRMITPEADLGALSFCGTTSDDIQEWVDNLPRANTGATAKALNMALVEVARLDTVPARRLAILEKLRTPLHATCARLDKSAKGSNPHSDSIAKAAQQLQKNLITGYKATVRDCVRKLSRSTTNTLSLSLHRAITDSSHNLLRSLKTYVPAAPHLWLEVNQMYRLAETLDLASVQHNDTENASTRPMSITECYVRALLLALSKPNELRHGQLNKLFALLEEWSTKVMLDQPVDDALFVVDLMTDRGPTYRELATDLEEPRAIRLDLLAFEVAGMRRSKALGGKHTEDDPHTIDQADEPLLDHLCASWSGLKKRNFKRAKADGTLKITLGLGATHHILSGCVDFAEQLSPEDAPLAREHNPFLKVQQDRDNAELGVIDVWQMAPDADHAHSGKDPSKPIELTTHMESIRRTVEGEAHAEAAKAHESTADSPEDKVRWHDVRIIDTSPGGYQIMWSEPPRALCTGELVAVRCETDPRWCVAVVRWIRQSDGGTNAGIELLSPRAIPVAARVVQGKAGSTDFYRALMLPELAVINQPATLITPLIPFREDHKVQIYRQGIHTTVQLGEIATTTESFNQFAFRMLDGYLAIDDSEISMDDLDDMIGESVFEQAP